MYDEGKAGVPREENVRCTSKTFSDPTYSFAAIWYAENAPLGLNLLTLD